MPSKRLDATISCDMPDDTFDQSAILAAAKEPLDQLKAILAEKSGNTVTVRTKIVSPAKERAPRKKKGAAAATTR